MMKNRYFAALAMAGLVSFAACGGDEGAEGGEGMAEDTAAVAPITPAPVVTDTAATGALPTDAGMDTTAAAGTDTAAHK